MSIIGQLGYIHGFRNKTLDSGYNIHKYKEVSLAGSAVELKREILDKIEAEMKKTGMSQAELGRMVGVERTDINKYLRGSNTAISLERLIEMAEAVGLEVKVTIKRMKG